MAVLTGGGNMGAAPQAGPAMPAAGGPAIGGNPQAMMAGRGQPRRPIAGGMGVPMNGFAGLAPGAGAPPQSQLMMGSPQNYAALRPPAAPPPNGMPAGAVPPVAAPPGGQISPQQLQDVMQQNPQGAPQMVGAALQTGTYRG